MFPKPKSGEDSGAFGSANGLFDAIVGCWALASLLVAVDSAEVFLAPKGLAPENVEAAKGFLDSANEARGEVLGLNNVGGAVVTVAGVSVF